MAEAYRKKENNDDDKAADFCNAAFVYSHANEVKVLKRKSNDLHKECRDVYKERLSLKIKNEDLTTKCVKKFVTIKFHSQRLMF